MLEVLVAAAILGIVLGTAASSLSQGAGFTRRSRQSGELERIASAHLELLLLRHERERLPTDGEAHFDEQGRPAPNGRYLSVWHVEDNRPVRGAGRITLRVQHDLDGTSAEFITYVAERRR